MTDTVIIIFESVPTGMNHDIEVPLDITVKELKNALSQGFQFEWKTEYVLRMEGSEDILEEDELLENYHLHDGTRLILDSNEQG